MALERRYIEEVGEAVEALGIMLERELVAIKQGLAELYQSLAQIQDEEKNLSQEVQKLKDETKTREGFLRGLENIMSRTESRLADLQKDYSDEEDLAGEIKNDLLVIKRELQFVRSDLKELLKQRGNVADKRSKDEKEKKAQDSRDG